MADIQPTAAPRSGKPRAKKLAFRLDMTPMVDLAFLLLTFFMLTTTFTKPTVMELAMPVADAAHHQAPVKPSQALTLILGKHGQVHYFFGLNAPDDPTVPRPTLHTTSFGPNGLRQVLLSRQRQQPAPVVLIKSTAEATYQNLVDALDEMTITNQQKYALVDLDRADTRLLGQQK